MSAVIPKEFNEPFVVPSDDGGTEERRLADMSADEVVAAMEWQRGYLMRLDDEMKHQAIQADTTNPLPQQIDRETKRLRRLLSLVTSRTPPQYKDVSLRTSLRQWWPGGPAA